MANIQVLDQITIDKIAAGEVIERPASIVKELVENSIDAGATAVTVEIKDGGISFIRITDNGCGIPKAEVPLAFLRHSTSKIRSVEDLSTVSSLGFRGEALSSICAIAQVELITKTKDSDFGTKYVIEGGKEKRIEEVGAPDGTTFLVHQIFYNTPARRKFLKTPMTEASHVNELMMRLALSHPEVSIQFINNGQPKIHTSGNGKLKDVIYHIFGRDIANNLLEVQNTTLGMKVTGFAGKPVISRGNRNYENYFINGRYVRNNTIAKAIEDAYKDFMMQHKYPFVALQFTMDGTDLDVNVHPTKMELRFSHQQEVYNFVCEALDRALNHKELIPEVEAPKVPKESQTALQKEAKEQQKEEVHDEAYFMRKMKERVNSYHNRGSQAEVDTRTGVFRQDQQMDRIKEAVTYHKTHEEAPAVKEPVSKPVFSKRVISPAARQEQIPPEQTAVEEKKPCEPALQKAEQLDLFKEKFLTKKAVQEFKLVGQIFETYWIIEYKEQMYIIDQHAAHERVLYEKTLRGMKEREFTSQYLSPPIVLNLSMQEAQILETHMDRFTRIGFEIEPFGGDSYAVRAIPDNLFGIAKKDLLIEMIDDLADGIDTTTTPDLIDEKIATMSCKAAVKGNSKLSVAEVQTLIGELLELENPYHCPHGRPTIVTMTKRELEKKFKRII